MHYLEVGEGPTVLFLHGTPSWSYLWRNVMKNMGRGRCIAVDMIGHGKSDFSDIIYNQHTQFEYLCEFIKQMNLKDLILVGHSYGANLALWYARMFKENVRAVSYLEPMLGEFKSWDDFNPDNPNAREFFKNFRNDSINHEMIIEKNLLIDAAFTNSALRSLSEEEKAAYRMPFFDLAKRKVLWDGGPRNLPIEGSPKEYCKVVNENFDWMKTTKVPQLFFYTEPAAFFSRKKAEEVISQSKNIQGQFLGEGRYSHSEDYPSEIGIKLTDWIQNINE